MGSACQCFCADTRRQTLYTEKLHGTKETAHGWAHHTPGHHALHAPDSGHRKGECQLGADSHVRVTRGRSTRHFVLLPRICTGWTLELVSLGRADDGAGWPLYRHEIPLNIPSAVAPSSFLGNDDIHIFEAVSWGWRLLVGRHRESQLHTAHRTAIANVDASHLASGWWRRQCAGHTAQHAEAYFPNQAQQYQAQPHPDNRAEHPVPAKSRDVR